MFQNSQKAKGKRGLGVLDLLVLVALWLVVMAMLLPSPSLVFTCSKCGNVVRYQNWYMLGEDVRCVTSTYPTTSSCKHPPFSSRVTIWERIGNAVDRTSHRLGDAVTSVAEFCRSRWRSHP